MMPSVSPWYGLGLVAALLWGGTVQAADPVALPELPFIPLGVVGHDNNAAYPEAQMEQRLQLLDRYNLRSYRSGEFLLLDPPRMDRLVALARQYNITLRPVITRQLTQAQAYALAKRYANDIKIWEIGNEQDYSRVGASIRHWMDLYLGQMRAMAEKYRTRIFFNEVNCGEIYKGTTDGGRPGDRSCHDSLEAILSELNGRYRDIVREINVYELLDEPTHSIPHERHFGLMYDLDRPKPVMELIRRYAGAP